MRRLPFIFIWLLVVSCWLLVSAPPARADWFSDLLFGLGLTQADQIMPTVVPAGLPADFGVTPAAAAAPASQLQEAQTGRASTQETSNTNAGGSTVSQLSGEYALECAKVGPPQDVTVTNDLGSFFERLLGSLGLIEVKDEGDKQAECWVQADLPPGVGEDLLARIEGKDRQLAQGTSSDETSVLGLQSSYGYSPVVVGLDLKRCQDYPPGVCTKDSTLAQLKPPPTNTPTPPPASPTFPQVPTGGPPNVGICPLGTGKCAPSYIESVLVNDLKISPANIPPGSMENASQICMKESGGNPFALNDSCLEPNATYRTRDYSVGLFQINLLVSTRCPGALRDNWPNECTILDRSKLEQCSWVYNPTTREYVNGIYTNPIKNIEFAWNLSGGGTNWKPWSTASVCKIYNPLPTPSVPAGGLVYYSQRASPWAQMPFDRLYYPPAPTPPQQCTVQRAACGPVTVAMLLSTYVDRSYNPEKVINDFYPNQPSCLSSMSQAIASMGKAASIYNKFGFRSDPIYSAAEPGQPLSPYVKNQMQTYLQNGSQIMAGANINGIGHFFWITEITVDGRIMVMDAWYGYDPVKQQPRAYPMDQGLIRDRNGNPAAILYKTIWAFHL